MLQIVPSLIPESEPMIIFVIQKVISRNSSEFFRMVDFLWHFLQKKMSRLPQ